MADRLSRHTAILRLVRERPLATQGELVDALRAEGFDVVQTTVSRDVAELGLVKARGRYVEPSGGAAPPLALGPALRAYGLSLEAAGGLVVVTTPAGFANALAEAIDRAALRGVAGTVAGDNTIFVAAREGVSAAALRDELVAHRLEGAA